ncbi:unnamed protein product [Penicillium glandicola]
MDDVRWDDLGGSDFIFDPELFSSTMEANHGIWDFPSLGVNNWAMADHGYDHLLLPSSNITPLPALDTPSVGGSSSGVSTNHSNPHDSQSNIHSEYPTPRLGSGCRDHDCPQEVCKIFGRLSDVNLMKPYSDPSSKVTSVPLDHILRLNREASEQLGRLLVLLYASNISRLLLWYQQATSCAQSPSRSPASLTPANLSQLRSPAPSSSGYSSESGVASMNWSSTGTNSTFNTVAKPTTSPTHLEMSVTTGKMAIGTFDVEDLQVQTALTIQLLLGEMRRASQLIDQFVASHGTSHQIREDEPSFGGLDSLYQSLDSWLRDEHSRIVNWMKSKLRGLNS